jgi:mannose-6-phosphate isomerase-like protein (cupin superfamily)
MLTMSEMGQTRHFDRAPTTSGLPRLTDVRGASLHVSKVPTAEEHHSHCDASQRGIYWRPPQVLREVDMSQGQSIRDASHLYEVERRVQHAARPGFRIMELQLSPTQKVPWHSHTNITDTFYVLEGHMRLFLQDPKEEVNLKPGEIHVVGAARPHLVTNGGTKSLTFLVLQGIGEYDYVPLTSS